MRYHCGYSLRSESQLWGITVPDRVCHFKTRVDSVDETKSQSMKIKVA
jgi:hypothetical protein